MATALKPMASNPHPIDHGVAIGHVHLKVSDLNRALDFYFGVLGFDLMQRYGDEAAFRDVIAGCQSRRDVPEFKPPKLVGQLASAIF
jgi:catechol 2,3-dioxygenase-like lactoylglutathione lyase family enzyme